MITDGRTQLAHLCNVVDAKIDKSRPRATRPVTSSGSKIKIKDLVLLLLEPGDDVAIKAINHAYPDSKQSSLAKAVSDLIVDGLVMRVGVGVYRMAP